MRIDDRSVSSNTCLHARGEIQLPWHLMISSIAMALHSQKLGQTIRSEWPPQVMSTLQWHHHTQTNLLRIAQFRHMLAVISAPRGSWRPCSELQILH
jgi:hypothetical protein